MLLVPFHMPQEPSAAHIDDIAASTAEDDLRSRLCEELCDLEGGGCGVWTRGTPSGSGGLRPRRLLEDRVGVCARGAEDVK